MTKYKITDGNKIIEFTTLAEAEAYNSTNGSSFPIDTVEEVLFQETNLPDVTPRQIRLKLLALGLTETDIDNTINTLPSPNKEAAMIAWKYSTAFQRRNTFVPMIGAMLGYNDAQLDQMWLEAALL